MAKTGRINLNITPASESGKRFVDFRTEIAGDGDDTNMIIIDKEIGDLQDGLSGHMGEEVASNSGAHGLRWNTADDKLERADGEAWVEIETGKVTSVNGATGDVTVAPVNHASDKPSYGTATAFVYGHTKASQSAPSAPGTAFVGTDNGLYARGDHVHPEQPAYTLPAATSAALGGVELWSDTVQTVAANAPSTTSGRTYGVQLNSAGQAVVNVPWTDANTTYTAMTQSEATTGTATTSRVISSKVLNDTIAAKISTSAEALQESIDLKENTSNKDAANGYAGLDENKKLPLSLFPEAIMSGQNSLLGNLNANTAVAALTANGKTLLGTTAATITLTNNTAAVTGYPSNEVGYYRITTAGTFAGLALNVGDFLVADDSGWAKQDNTDAVTSVNGATGDVTVAPVNHASDKPSYGTATAFVYGHTKASQSAPSAPGTAFVGTDNGLYARGDHVHPEQPAYTLPAATSAALGGVELWSDTVQTVAANAPSTTSGRTYGVQLNSAGQAVVNVPWSNTNTTYTAMTQSEATTGTATTARSITAKVLNDTITAKVSASETTLQSAIGAEQSARESGDAAINALIGAANGIAPLDADAKIPVANLPSNIGGGGGKRYAQIVVGNTSAGYTAADVDILVDGTNVSNDLISAITSHVNDILLLPGRYDIPQNLALGNATTIRGSGNAASYMTRSQLYGAASATLNVRFENKISNVMLSKWTLTGGGVYDGCAFDGAYGIFRQIINSAIDARDSYTCTSSGAMFCNNVTASGRPGTGTITFSGQTIGGVISGNYFGAFGGIVLSSANHLSISNNVFKNIGASGGTAITLTNSNRCAITGNVSVGPLYDKGVILNTSSNNTIVGNVFYNQDRTTYTQISIGSGSNYNTVVGNQASIVNSGTGNVVGSNY